MTVMFANAIECLECSELTMLPRDMTQRDAEREYCPNDNSHGPIAILVTDAALGLENDRDYWNHGSEQFEYPLQDLND